MIGERVTVDPGAAPRLALPNKPPLFFGRLLAGGRMRRWTRSRPPRSRNPAAAGINSACGPWLALPLVAGICDDLRMDASAQIAAGKPARLQNWLARHFAAMLAVAVVLGVLGSKNLEYRLRGVGGLSPNEFEFGLSGWPKQSIERTYYFHQRAIDSRWEVISWAALLLDAFVAAMWLAVTWFVFNRTQRSCQRWHQLSLLTVLAITMLAGVVCAVLKTESAWTDYWGNESTRALP